MSVSHKVGFVATIMLDVELRWKKYMQYYLPFSISIMSEVEIEKYWHDWQSNDLIVDSFLAWSPPIIMDLWSTMFLNYSSLLESWINFPLVYAFWLMMAKTRHFVCSQHYQQWQLGYFWYLTTRFVKFTL